MEAAPTLRAQAPCSLRALPTRLGEEESLAFSFQLHLLPPVCGTAQPQGHPSGVAGRGWHGPRLSPPPPWLPSRGPEGACESLEGSAQPQTGSGSSSRNSLQDLARALSQVSWAAVDEGREADWGIAKAIQILPELK